ncbi:MAG: hypothetical protein Kow006_24280 [Gammaproteobacteria bacterium]
MSAPLVSICIPNYNNGRYLDACLQSALGQTYPNTEIVLVDDASSDDSMTVAERYRDRIALYRNRSNLGQPLNTNTCVARSRGDYVVILHSDDMLLPNFAADLVPLLADHPNVGMAVGERLEIGEQGEPHSIAPFYNTDCIIPGERQAKVFLFASYLPCQVLLRRTIFERVGGVDERHIVNLDGLLWFKCALTADVAYVRTPVSVYRVHGESTTARYNRTIDHMLEYYATLSEMFRQGRGRPYLEQHFEAARRRVGQLALRYAHSIFRAGDYDLVQRYLSLATAFDPLIADDFSYQTLSYCTGANTADRQALYRKLFGSDAPEKRTFSYDPPEGAVRLREHRGTVAAGASHGR